MGTLDIASILSTKNRQFLSLSLTHFPACLFHPDVAQEAIVSCFGLTQSKQNMDHNERVSTGTRQLCGGESFI